jgi:CspA family cold shock protein
MLSHGTVREWDDDEGCGVIDSADTPGGCFAGFASIVMDGYRSLTPGAPVTFTHEAARQDGLGYRAVRVWPPGARAGTPPAAGADSEPSAAYRSTLTIRRADGTVTEYPGDGPGPFPPASRRP